MRSRSTAGIQDPKPAPRRRGAGIVLGALVILGLAASAPDRLQAYEVIDYWTRPVVPGLIYLHYKLRTGGGQAHAYVLVMDLTNPNLNIKPALANHTVGEVATVSEICRQHGAIAGINGSFFDISSPLPLPIGFIMIDGRVVFLTTLKKLTFGLTADRRVVFGVPDAKGIIYVGDQGKHFYAWGMNRPRKQDEIIVYTPRWGTSTKTNQHGIEFMIRQGRVQTVMVGDAPIPRDGFVISMHGASKAYSDLLLPGADVRFVFSVERPWSTVYQALTGDRLLLEQGRVVVAEASNRNSRSAVGVTRGGRLALAVADRSSHSVGMNFKELAHFLQGLGVTDAISLDGGGSSTMVVGCEVVNPSRQGAERRVSNALLITDR